MYLKEVVVKLQSIKRKSVPMEEVDTWFSWEDSSGPYVSYYDLNKIIEEIKEEIKNEEEQGRSEEPKRIKG